MPDKLFDNLKPSILTVNQPNTQFEGAIKGKLRITGYDEQFDRLHVVMITEPEYPRAYYTGSAGTMNRKPENLICFSKDSVRPDDGSTQKQSVLCATCPKGDVNWDTHRALGDNATRSSAPPCDQYFKVTYIAQEYKLPLVQYVRSTMKKPFKNGLNNGVAKLIYLAKAEGKTVNLWDYGFTLSTSKIVTRGLPSYIVNISDTHWLSDQERASFGRIYADIVSPPAPEEPALTDQDKVDGIQVALDQRLTASYDVRP